MKKRYVADKKVANIEFKQLEIIAKKSCYDIVRMISNAKSGHIGGSLSSADIYLLLLRIMEQNDRLVISHGHSAAVVY